MKLTVGPAAIAGVAVLLSSTPAHAYLDPGTGSMAIQVIIGAVAAGLVTVKMFWARLMSLFGGKPSDKSAPSGKDTD